MLRAYTASILDLKMAYRLCWPRKGGRYIQISGLDAAQMSDIIPQATHSLTHTHKKKINTDF